VAQSVQNRLNLVPFMGVLTLFFMGVLTLFMGVLTLLLTLFLTLLLAGTQ